MDMQRRGTEATEGVEYRLPVTVYSVDLA